MKVNKTILLEVIVLVIGTLLVYWPSFQFDFVNYDDQVYVLENAFIQNPTLNGLLDGAGTGNFHPVTMLSLLFDKIIGGDSPRIFHITSVLWHILNSLLVFILVRKIAPAKKGIELFIALLFAIHPMHIESVAWISSRKDLVYTFFYLIALLSYYQYIISQNLKWIILTLVVGSISLLSKPAAITLPFALLLLEFYINKKINLKKSIFLTPLFLGSIVIGLVTMRLQSADAINDLTSYSIVERIGFAFYGIAYYVSQCIVPSGLAPMHAFPSDADLLSAKHIAYIVSGILLTTGGLYLSKKDRFFAFSFFFFIGNLVLMLQLISVGRAIVSERYTYLAYIGLFLVFVSLMSRIAWVQKTKNVYYGLTLLLCIPFFVVAKKQVLIWKNSETLWSKAIAENADDWYGYIGRGNYYTEKGFYQNAVNDFENAVRLNPQKFENYFNLGDAQNKAGYPQKAVESYSRAIELKPTYIQAYINRGQFYVTLRDGAKALEDFNTAIDLDSTYSVAYNNRGNLYQLAGNSELAIRDFTTSIRLDSSFTKAYYNRGTAYLGLDPMKAIQDLKIVVNMDPSNFEAYNNLGSAYYNLKEYEKAENSFKEALKIDSSSSSTWINLSLVQKLNLKYSESLASALKGEELGSEISQSYIQELQSLVK